MSSTGALGRLQALRFAPTPLRGAPAAAWTRSARTGTSQPWVAGNGLQPQLPCSTTIQLNRADPTLTTPDFGPKNGVHLILRLAKELRGQTYRPGSYRTFWVREPKRRLISAAPFRDRVVHQALVRVIEPIFERRFIHHSYACRRGKGTHRALRQFVRWGRASRYVLKMDVRKFFPTIDHAVLQQGLRRVLKDPDVLRLCEVIIDGSNPQERVVQHFPGDDLFTPVRRRIGLPIGNLTSQFFANVYLDPLDHFVKERLRVRRYLRYSDDFCCFGNEKSELREVRSAVGEFLMGLRLRLNEGKSRVRQLKEGVEFLGFVVTPDRLRLNRTAIRRQRRRLRRLRAEYATGAIDWPDVAASLRAWAAHAAHGDTWNLLRAVFGGAPFSRSGRPVEGSAQ